MILRGVFFVVLAILLILAEWLFTGLRFPGALLFVLPLAILLYVWVGTVPRLLTFRLRSGRVASVSLLLGIALLPLILTLLARESIDMSHQERLKPLEAKYAEYRATAERAAHQPWDYRASFRKPVFFVKEWRSADAEVFNSKEELNSKIDDQYFRLPFDLRVERPDQEVGTLFFVDCYNTSVGPTWMNTRTGDTFRKKTDLCNVRILDAKSGRFISSDHLLLEDLASSVIKRNHS